MTDIGSAMVTSAEDDLVGLAIDVAVTVTSAGFGTIAGAVYKPAVEIVPHPDPVQPAPAMLHETDVLALPVTTAENCREAEGASFTEVGAMETVTTETTVTVAVADLVGSATEVAVTAKNGGVGGTGGAVYNPEVLIVPHVVPAQPAPVIVQFTDVFAEPVTVAVNC